MAGDPAGFVVFDMHGVVVATHQWAASTGPQHCPLDVPSGGRVVRVRDRRVVEQLQDDHAHGRHTALSLRGGRIFRGDAPLVDVEDVER